MVRGLMALFLAALALTTSAIAHAGGNIGANPVRHAVSCSGQEMDVQSDGGAPVSCPSSGGGGAKSDIKPQTIVANMVPVGGDDPHDLTGTYPKVSSYGGISDPTPSPQYTGPFLPTQ